MGFLQNVLFSEFLTFLLLPFALLSPSTRQVMHGHLTCILNKVGNWRERARKKIKVRAQWKLKEIECSFIAGWSPTLGVNERLFCPGLAIHYDQTPRTGNAPLKRGFTQSPNLLKHTHIYT